MSKNISKNDIRTLGIVLRRTNYGEADRIINIITREGKIAAIAKGSRREKSKLAGGIEMFSLTDFNLHIGQSEFAIITGAKMIKFYSGILSDYSRMEFAGSVLKKINAASENSDSPEYFGITKQVLSAIDGNIDLELIKSWFVFNLTKASGEEINLYRDASGEKLDATKRYIWDFNEKALSENPNGDIGANEIKIMRLILTSKLATVSKIKNIGDLLSPIFRIAQGF